MDKIYKIIHVITTVLVVSLSVNAQQIANLEGINYQAVAIDTEGKEIVGKDIEGKPLYLKDIGVRFTITEGDNGDVYYQETHSTTTDENGLFSLTIGLGELTEESTYDALLDMPWINGDQWLRVEIAIEDDGDYEEAVNEKLMTVPYSFYTHDIADDAITTYKILDSTILNQDFSTGAVDTRVIEDSTILNEDFSTGAVDTRVILDYTILEEDFSTGAVDTRVILDSTILEEDFSTGAVDSRVIEDFTILNEDFSTEAVDTRVIEDSTVLNEDMSTGSVDSRVIEDFSLQNEDFADESINSRTIEDGSIVNEDFADGTIDLTTKVNNILPVANGGTGRNELTQEGFLVGNNTDPVTVIETVEDGNIITHRGDETDLYQMVEGPLLTIEYNDGDKTITFTAVEQDLGDTGVGSGISVGNINPGEQLIRNFPTPANVGDVLMVGTDVDLEGLTLTGYVSDQDNIRFIFYNGSNASVNIGPLNITVLNLGQ